MMWMNRRFQSLILGASALVALAAAYLWLGPSVPTEGPVVLPVTANEASSESGTTIAPPPAQAPPPQDPTVASPSLEAKPLDAQPDADSPLPGAVPQGPDAAVAPLPPLTPIIVKDHPVNTIPSEPEAPKPTGDPRLGLPAGNGKSIGQSAEVAFGPRRDTGGPPPQRQFSDKAAVTGPTTLTVGAVQVKLFGVAALKPSDRCGSLPGDSDCLATARTALIRKIGTQGNVSCHVPNPRPGIPLVSAICLDPQGVDLGGFLIAEGLATADTSQSYDYVGAENVAHTLKRGVWQYR